MRYIKYCTILIGAICISVALYGCAQSGMHPEIAKPGTSFSANINIDDSLKIETPDNAKYIYELGVDIEKSKSQIERCLNVSLDDYDNDSLIDDYISYTIGDWTADIMTENGYWTIGYLGNKCGEADDISDEDAVKIAAGYLKEHALIGDDVKMCDAIGLNEGLRDDGSYGVLSKEPYFYPKINEMTVLGIFRIGVTVNTDGKVVGVDYLVSPVVDKIPAVLADRPAIEAEIAAHNYSASFSQNLSDIKITAANYRLYADGKAVDDGKTYLYPVLVLLGQGKTADGNIENFDVIIDAQK